MEQYPNCLHYYEELKYLNIELKAQVDLAISNYNMFSKHVNHMEQMHISNYVDILGVPKCDEDYISIIQNMASYLGVELSVVQAFRIPSKTKNKSGKIVAEFMSLEQKQTFMQLAKEKDLHAKDLNNDWINARIFVNESLSSYYRHLFQKVKLFAKEKGFKIFWYHDCKCYMKKDNNSKTYVIEDESDLLKIA